MRLRLSLSLFLVLLTAVVTNSQECPPCYYNQPPIPQNHGTAQDGRQAVNIYIDPQTLSDSNEYAKAEQAAFGAAGQWNNATDFSGNKIPYNVGVTSSPYYADFIVKKGTTFANCINIDTSVYPHVITVGSNWLGSSAEERAGRIAHELGHRFGLAHPDDVSNNHCSANTTIMQGATTLQCTGGSTQVTASDVAKVRQDNNPSTRGNCLAETTPATTDCIDADGDGCTLCAGDPDDNDASIDCSFYDDTQQHNSCGYGGYWIITEHWLCSYNSYSCTYWYSEPPQWVGPLCIE